MLKILAGVGAVALLLIALIAALMLMVGGNRGRPVWPELDNFQRFLIVAFFVVNLGSSAFLAHVAKRPSEPRE